MIIRSKYMIVLTGLFLCACNTVKYLKPDQELYTGADVSVRPAVGVHSKEVRKEMEKVLRPEPNQTFLGKRYQLWFWYKAGEDPKGLKKFMKNKLGEPPVLYDPLIPVQVSDIMVNRLNNLGFFDAVVTYSSTVKDKQAKVFYTVSLSRPYRLKEINLPAQPGMLFDHIRESASESLLSRGIQYKLDDIKAERERIDEYLKERGYFFFNPDYLLFKADSTGGDKEIDLRLTVKPDAPPKAIIPYRYDELYVYPSFSQHHDSLQKQIADTVVLNDVHYVNAERIIKPSTLDRAIFIRKGDRYSRKTHTQTLSRLMGMNVFQYANVRFEDTIINSKGSLKTSIYLSPMEKRAVQIELQAVTKSNNYSGPAVILSYRNRNLFRGGELLVVNLNGNYETQFTGIQKGFNSWELGANTQLFLPGFVTPVRIKNVSTRFVPKTKFDLGFRNLNRVLYFNMQSLSFTYGYIWKETKLKEHEFNPVATSFAQLRNTTRAFDELLEANPFLRRTFEQQFTVGGYYAFTYNSMGTGDAQRQYYYNGLIDVSGNALSLLNRISGGGRPDPDNPFQLFGYTYSQYVKIANDVRYHHTLDKHSKIAFRLIGGVGVPYGNSTSLPYLKQFFSGGANSIRAFLPRTVGPGVYVTPDSLLRRRFLDQAGDMKLEGSAEYRFTIIGILKGALFVDAGNVWLFRQNDEVPGGEFRLNEFYKQLAVGTGFGLRADITYFVLRFDLGMPLRKPYLPDGDRWVMDRINLGDGRWRSQNLVLNIAIGYPF